MWILAVFLIVSPFFIAYLFRTLATIVDGLRSISATNLRIAAAVEALATEQASRTDRSPR
jgi:hypothetical protein